MTTTWIHVRNGKVIGWLDLTDEKALDLLTHGWDIRPNNREQLMERLTANV